MRIEIEKMLAAACEEARRSGDDGFAQTCELVGVGAGVQGADTVEVSGDSLEDAFDELNRMVNDQNVPLERARLIRLFLAWKGHIWSQYMQGYNFQFGRNIRQDYVLAGYWYSKSAERGHAWPQNNLGVMYADGLGVERDPEKAVALFMQSAEGGDAVAKGNLGEHLVEGCGVRRNYRRAAKLLVEYLKTSPYNARAHRLLAVCYEHGVGGRNGRRLAIQHYQDASDFGSLKARAALRRLTSRSSGAD